MADIYNENIITFISAMLLIASMLLCVCAYKEGTKLAESTRFRAEVTSQSMHAFGEPGNPANSNYSQMPAIVNMSDGSSGANNRITSSDIGYTAPLPPPYSGPPNINANIYAVPDNGGDNNQELCFFANVPEQSMDSINDSSKPVVTPNRNNLLPV
jgi:hypothetical protein